MKEKFLNALADRMKAEDIVHLVCRFMLANDAPELKFQYGGRQRIVGCVIKGRGKGSHDEASFNIQYAGDENT